MAAGWKIIQMLTIRDERGIIWDVGWFENISAKVEVNGEVGSFRQI